jgi:hypothetical protein
MQNFAKILGKAELPAGRQTVRVFLYLEIPVNEVADLKIIIVISIWVDHGLRNLKGKWIF